MNDKLKQVKSLHEFACFVASLRTTGGGWTVIGDEPFQGDSARVVLIDDLAQKAKELVAAKTLP